MSDYAPITVNLTSRSWAALSRLSSRHGDTQTDALNRAIQVADYLDAMVDEARACRPDPGDQGH